MSDLNSEQKNSENLAKLNAVSSCFCLAKWLQVTVDLVHGMTHSCHHPKRHKIPLAELEKDPGALHNTIYKKEQRKKMLEGERPKECSYCWDMEDLGNKYSDRYIKSTDPWSWNQLEKISNLPWDANVNPSYLEVMLDKTCNFSCAYCMADISSSIEAEMKTFGAYPGFANHHRKPPHTDDPKTDAYRIAFFKWLPQIIRDLKVLRITGGEPLLSRHFWTLLQEIKELPGENLQFIVNSHLNHPEVLLNRFISEIKTLKTSQKISDFSLYVSLDTYQEQAEYIRSGLSYDRVIENLKVISREIPNTEIVLMCTFNVLSIARFDSFLSHVIELKKQFPIVLDISYLRAPEYLRADLATPQMIDKMSVALQMMKSSCDLFTEHEINKFENVFNWVVASSKQTKEIEKWRGDLFRFVKEYDRRKKKNFIEVFPEYSDFFKVCKIAALDQALGNHVTL